MLIFRAASANPNVKDTAVNDPFVPLDYVINQLQYDSVRQRFNGWKNCCCLEDSAQRQEISGTASSAVKYHVLDPNGTSEGVARRRG